MPDETFELSGLVLKEISLVDFPANQHARVCIVKAAGKPCDAYDGPDTGVCKTCGKPKAMHAPMTKSETDLTARGVGIVPSAAPSETRGAPVAEIDLSKLDEATRQHIEALEKTLADTKAELAKSAPAPEPDAEDLLKGISGPARQAIEKLQSDMATALAKAAAAEESARAEIAKRETAEEVAKVRALPHLALDAEKFGPALRALRKSDADAAAAIDEALAAADAQAALGNLTNEIGAPTAGTVGKAWDRFNAEAAKLVEAGKAPSHAEAITMVKAAQPDLYEQYLAEQA